MNGCELLNCKDWRNGMCNYAGDCWRREQRDPYELLVEAERRLAVAVEAIKRCVDKGDCALCEYYIETGECYLRQALDAIEGKKP